MNTDITITFPRHLADTLSVLFRDTAKEMRREAAGLADADVLHAIALRLDEIADEDAEEYAANLYDRTPRVIGT